ncbi:MAG: alpha/beta hydrolase [Nakamurella sp.]
MSPSDNAETTPADHHQGSWSAPDPDRYRQISVPVRGGELRVGIWEPAGTPTNGAKAPADGATVPTVIAVHGVTSSHRAFLALAGTLTEFRVVAPDLRGRGGSRELAGPFGMAQHADDIVALMDFLEIDTAVLVGHSMGGFVTVALHGRHPERVGSMVLVDGGLPLPAPAGISDDELTTARLGLAKQRLSMTFPDRESYRTFWRAHPALAADWSPVVEDYVDYDLVGDAPNLRSATAFEAMADDSVDLQNGGEWLLAALDGLPTPTPFLRAERGMADEPVGLYPPEWIDGWQQRVPAVQVRDVLGVNHYTILFNDIGVSAVAAAVRAAF